MPEGSASKPPSVGLWELVRYFLRLGWFGFGGPIALAGEVDSMIAMGAELTAEEKTTLIEYLAKNFGPKN